MSKRQPIEEEVDDSRTEGVAPLKPQSYRPLLSILTEPVTLFHTEKVTRKSAFSSLSGRWSSIKAKKTTPLANRDYAVRAGPMGAIPNVKLYVYQDDKQVGTLTTDKEGKAHLDLPVKQPMYANYKVSVLPSDIQAAIPASLFGPFSDLPVPPVLPTLPTLDDIFTYGVWNARVQITNRTDRWYRFAGRDLEGKLPRNFWARTYGSRYSIGLGSTRGTQIFEDTIPVFDDNSIKVVYGISAMCNTREGNPTAEACKAARLNTWWNFKVTGSNGLVTQIVAGDLNVDRQLEVIFKGKVMVGRVIRSPGAQT